MELANYIYEIDWNGNGLYDHAYSNVSDYVLRSSWSFNIPNGPPEHANAGTCYIRFDNSSAIFSSFNVSSPIYGLIRPGLGIRIKMTANSSTVTMFCGEIQSLNPFVADLPNVNYAELQGIGILARFADEGDVNIALQENITTGAAINLLLDQDNIPAGDRAVDTGQSTISKWWITNGSSRMQCFRDLEDEELGRFREGKDGKFIFEDRAHIFTATRSKDIQSTYGTGILRPYNLKQIDPLPGIFNKVQAQVRTFNKSENVALVTLADVQNNLGGTPPAVPAGTGSPVTPGTLTIYFDFPTKSSPTDYIGVDSWGIVDYEANTKADRTGTDITAYVSAVRTEYGSRLQVDFSNSYTGVAYLVVLRANGNAIIESDPIPLKSEDTVSQGKYKTRNYPYPSQWITNQEDGQAKLDYIIQRFKNPRPRLSFEVKANYDLTHLIEAQQRDISDRIHVTAMDDFGLYVDYDFIIDQISHNVDEFRMHIMTVYCTMAPTLQLAASGTVYAAKIIPQTTDQVPADLWPVGLVSSSKIIIGGRARQWNLGIYQADMRAKLIPTGQTQEYVDLRTPEEGGTFVDNGTTQLIFSGISAAWNGILRNLFYGANTGRWYFAFRFKNITGWSLWSDGNPTPARVIDYVDTDQGDFADTGPPADWTVTLKQGPQSGTAVAIASRPRTNGNRIWFAFFQIKDSTTGSWRNIDANTGAAQTLYDGSAISHTLDPATGTLTKASGDYSDAATYGGLILMDVRQGSFDQKYTRWGVIPASQISGSTISGMTNFLPDFEPDINGKYTDVRIKVVVAPWSWSTEGYLGQTGYQALEYWDNPTRGDLDSLTFESKPFVIPAGVNLEDLQARVWFGTDYSFSDGGIYSECPLPADTIPPAPGVITINYSATITLDCGSASIFYVTLTGNANLANFLNPRHGIPIILVVIQDATGGRTLTINGSKFVFGNEVTSGVAVVDSRPYARTKYGFSYYAPTDKIDVDSYVSGYI